VIGVLAGHPRRGEPAALVPGRRLLTFVARA
jgi:hypothetical protein